MRNCFVAIEIKKALRLLTIVSWIRVSTVLETIFLIGLVPVATDVRESERCKGI